MHFIFYIGLKTSMIPTQQIVGQLNGKRMQQGEITNGRKNILLFCFHCTYFTIFVVEASVQQAGNIAFASLTLILKCLSASPTNGNPYLLGANQKGEEDQMMSKPKLTSSHLSKSSHNKATASSSPTLPSTHKKSTKR